MPAKLYQVLAVTPPPKNSAELEDAIRAYVKQGYSLAQVVLDCEASAAGTMYLVRVKD